MKKTSINTFFSANTSTVADILCLKISLLEQIEFSLYRFIVIIHFADAGCE
jgi:hypothetical protein